MRPWLVTGASGFIGRQVLNVLRGKDLQVLALGRNCPAGWEPGHFVAADFDFPETIAKAIGEIQPEVVIHAAGQTPPADPTLLYRANTVATIHLLDSLRALRKHCRVVIAGSAAEYGPIDVEDLPVAETYPSRPTEPYGLSKWLATCAGMAARAPLEVVSARIFNPIGPGQPSNQAFGRFAASLSAEVHSPLIVGDLESRRDFLDVRDVARALVILGETGRVGLIYNLGSGRSHSVGEGLAHLILRSGRQVEVLVDPSLFGGSGPKDSRAHVGRIFEHTQWRPEICFERSLDDLWSEVVGRCVCH